jgi:hypothetical protein
MTFPSAEERAWLAGIFEGEGSFSGKFENGRGKGRTVRAKLGMSDRDTVEKFHRLIGIGNVSGPYLDSKGISKPMWVWCVGSFELFQQTVCYLWPWLGERRRAKATELLMKHNAWRPVPKELRKKCGQPQKRERNQEIVQLFRAGAKQIELMKQFGLSSPRIRAILIRYNSVGA